MVGHLSWKGRACSPGMQALLLKLIGTCAFLYAGDIFPEFLEQNEGSNNVEDPDSTMETALLQIHDVERLHRRLN